MTRNQARMIAHDESESDPKRLNEAAAVLLSNLYASDDDMWFADSLLYRVQRLPKAAE